MSIIEKQIKKVTCDMDRFSITKNGNPLDESLYSIDKNHMIFASKEWNLVLNFRGLRHWTFKTGCDCTFITGDSCIFKTSSGCTFNTGYHCTFKTSSDCTFTTKGSCTFSLWDINSCTFKTGDGYSIILDRLNNEAYKLTEEFVKLQKVVNG